MKTGRRHRLDDGAHRTALFEFLGQRETGSGFSRIRREAVRLDITAIGTARFKLLADADPTAPRDSAPVRDRVQLTGNARPLPNELEGSLEILTEIIPRALSDA